MYILYKCTYYFKTTVETLYRFMLHNSLLPFIPQGFMCAPSVITSCSPAAPSMNTLHPGQLSQRPSMKTVCPNMRRGLGHTRYHN